MNQPKQGCLTAKQAAFFEGYAAQRAGIAMVDNPYVQRDGELWRVVNQDARYDAWNNGYQDARYWLGAPFQTNQLFPNLDATLAFVRDFVARPENFWLFQDIHLTIEDNGWRVIIQK